MKIAKLLTIMSLVFTFLGCSLEAPEEKSGTYYTVRLLANYEGAETVVLDEVSVKEGKECSEFKIPYVSSHYYAGAFKEPECINPFYPYANIITQNIDVYANWTDSVNYESTENSPYMGFQRFVEATLNDDLANESSLYGKTFVHIYKENSTGSKITVSLSFNSDGEISSYYVVLEKAISGVVFTYGSISKTATTSLSVRLESFYTGSSLRNNNHLGLEMTRSTTMPMIDGVPFTGDESQLNDICDYFTNLGYGKLEVKECENDFINVGDLCGWQMPAQYYYLIESYSE